MFGAGAATIACWHSVATHHLPMSPSILAKLKAELNDAIPDPNIAASLPILEKLPYLNAVVQQALRLRYGVSSRLQRISPGKATLFTDASNAKTWTIPPGTLVGMTSVLIHHDMSLFPDSRAFRPERWLEMPRLDRYLVPFPTGSRQCLGN